MNFFFIPFFKVHHPSTGKPKALVGFEPRTEPELGTGDSHSTSTLLPPIPTGLEYWTGILKWPKLLDSEFCVFYKLQ